jgi:hypothetical protein
MGSTLAPAFVGDGGPVFNIAGFQMNQGTVLFLIAGAVVLFLFLKR